MAPAEAATRDRRLEAETLCRTHGLTGLASERMGATLRPERYRPERYGSGAEPRREAIPVTRASSDAPPSAPEELREAAGADGGEAASLPAITWREPGARLDGGQGSEGPITALGVLGEGGMGRVLLAQQRAPRRQVAVKVLRDAGSASLAAALVHEGHVLGRVEHPNVVPVHAIGSDADGGPALILKRIDGVPWLDLIRDAGHPHWSEVRTLRADRMQAHLEILATVAQAVHHAHQRGILHRDVKADNVIVGRFGEVYLADWGIAMSMQQRPEGSEQVVGTPTHLAPEMARGDVSALDERTDVYLLGATLHEILTEGRGRHRGANVVQLIYSALCSDPVSYGPDVPLELARIANRAMAPAPEDRFADALSFRDAIALHLQHAGSIALAQATAGRRSELIALAEAADAGRGEGSDDHGGSERDGSGRDGSEVEVRERLYRLLSECRFGYGQALEAWPDNEEAQRQLNECLVAVTRFELAAGRSHAASALLGELRDPPPDLTEGLRALEQEEDRRRRRQLELERLERDVDVSLSATQYAWLFGALVALLTGLAAGLLLARSKGVEIGPRGITISAGVSAVVLLGIVAIWREQLLDRRASRGVAATLVAVFVGVFLQRAAGWAAGAAVEHVLVGNAVLVAACFVTAAFLVRPWFASFTAGFLLCAIAGVMWPAWAGPFFLLTVLICGCVGTWLWYRDQRDEQSRARADGEPREP